MGKSELLVSHICYRHNQGRPCRIISPVQQVLEKQKGKKCLAVLMQLYHVEVTIDLSKAYACQAGGQTGSLCVSVN